MSGIAAEFDRRIGGVMIRFSDGLEITYAPKDGRGLEAVRAHGRNPFRIRTTGGGIHIQPSDADLCMAALLEGYLGPRRE